MPDHWGRKGSSFTATISLRTSTMMTMTTTRSELHFPINPTRRTVSGTYDTLTGNVARRFRSERHHRREPSASMLTGCPCHLRVFFATAPGNICIPKQHRLANGSWPWSTNRDRNGGFPEFLRRDRRLSGSRLACKIKRADGPVPMLFVVRVSREQWVIRKPSSGSYADKLVQCRRRGELSSHRVQ